MNKFVIVSASHRAGSESRRISEELNARYFDGTAEIVDLYALDLPLWNGEHPITPDIQQMQDTLAAADGFVFVVPEWHGMAPAGVKNLFLWCNFTQFAHKPALLVAVSGSVGGAFVVAEMRASSYKNSRLLWLPEHLILRDTASLWKGEESKSDVYLASRAGYAVEHLKIYAEMLAPRRNGLAAGLKDYPNGMS